MKKKRILVVTENTLGVGQFVGLLPNIFYKIYNFFYFHQLRTLLSKNKGKIVLITSRNLIADQILPQNTKVYFYDRILFDVNYLESRKKAWNFSRNWYRMFPKLNLDKKFIYKGVNLNNLIFLRLAILVNQSILAYYQAMENILRETNPDFVYLFSGLSAQEKIAYFLARKKKIHCEIAFRITLVPFDLLIKKFLRSREVDIIWRNVFKMAKEKNNIEKTSIVHVATGILHLKSVIPLARRIARKFPVTILTDFISAENSLKSLAGEEFKNSYIFSHIGFLKIIEIKKHFEGYFARIWQEIDQSFEFNINNKEDLIFLLVKDYLKNRIRGLLPLVIGYIEATEQFIKKNKPKLGVFISDRGTFEACFSTLAKKYEIPTILYSPNNVMSIDMTNNYDIADYLLITGEHMRDELLKIGHTLKNVSIVGDLRFDDLKNQLKNFNREEICSRVNIDPNKKLILLISLYSSDYSPVYEKRKYFQAVEEALEKIPKAELLIRPHPGENLGLLKQQIRDWKIKKGKIITNLNIYELLFITDVVVMLHSMIGFEALVFGKPVIAVNLLKKNYQKYVPYGGSILQIEKDKNLYPAICELLDESSKLRKHLIKKGEKFYQNYLGKVDGKVAERVEKEILRLIVA